MQEPDIDGAPDAKRQRCLPAEVLTTQDVGVGSQATTPQIREHSDAEQQEFHNLGILSTVPAELLFRILSFLSADDLTCTAQACTYLRNATGSGMLWRRLFLAR